MKGEENIYEAIIVGAGPAGIGAASVFQKQGLPYIVLQARLRIGGRVLSQQIDDVKIDLGACWIHSFSNNNPLIKYVNKFQVKECKLNHNNQKRVFYDGQQHQIFDEQIQEYATYNQSQFFNNVKESLAHTQNDISLYDAAGQHFHNKIQSTTGPERRCTSIYLNMAEHYDASSLKQLSASNYDYRQDEGGDFLPAGTYAGLIRNISQRLNIYLNKKVTKILRNNGIAEVSCSDGSVFKSKKIIVSLPLGVLKANSVVFSPQIPQTHQMAISKLGVGLMNKIVLSFSQNFWGPIDCLSFGFDERGKYPHFFNFSQQGKHILCCFVTDDFGRKCQQKTDEQIVKQIMDILQNTFSKNRVQLKQAIVTRWGKDELSRGSYSSFHVGSGPEDSFMLRQPIDNELWFVGEHCYGEHIGTAHGAMQTGEWAAKAVLDVLQWVKPIQKTTTAMSMQQEQDEGE